MPQESKDKSTPEQPPAPPEVGSTPAVLVGGIDLNSDPDINFHLSEDEDEGPKTRFTRWSRTVATRLEKKVYAALGGKTNPWLFVPQVEICGFIVDFYSPVYKIVIEADGPDHALTVLQDKQRDELLLKKKGIRTLRFTPKDVETYTAQDIYRYVEFQIQQAVEETTPKGKK